MDARRRAGAMQGEAVAVVSPKAAPLRWWRTAAGRGTTSPREWRRTSGGFLPESPVRHAVAVAWTPVALLPVTGRPDPSTPWPAVAAWRSTSWARGAEVKPAAAGCSKPQRLRLDAGDGPTPVEPAGMFTSVEVILKTLPPSRTSCRDNPGAPRVADCWAWFRRRSGPTRVLAFVMLIKAVDDHPWPGRPAARTGLLDHLPGCAAGTRRSWWWWGWRRFSIVVLQLLQYRVRAGWPFASAPAGSGSFGTCW